jgi:hypothetical protein
VVDLVVLGEDGSKGRGLHMLLAFGLECGGADAVQFAFAVIDALAFPGRVA